MSRLPPIFIHSLFRAGSTYLFNCFRRSPAGYWCYQEPFNEFLLNAGVRPEALLEIHEDNARHLRHPRIDRPYFYEYFHLAPQIAQTFCASLSYEDYFCSAPSQAEPMCRYLTVLADGARGRPVFQECRSAGRVAAIRECLGGVHIHLWRNPWDQWWSYKVDSHFEICNLQILASGRATPLFLELRTLLGFDPPASDVRALVGQRLDAAGSYSLFFALWCHAMLEALPRCDVDFNIDSVSRDEGYRNAVLAKLEAHAITGLELSDCSVPVGTYGEDDREFFDRLEQRVLELHLRHGYTTSDVERLNRLRDEHDCHGRSGGFIPTPVARACDRVRQVARRLESELSGAQRDGGRLAGVLGTREAECKSLAATLGASEAERRSLEAALATEAERRRSLELTLEAKEAERRTLEATLAAEAERRRSLESTLEAKEIERQSLANGLARIRSSRYWRWGRPIRATGDLALRFLGRSRG